MADLKAQIAANEKGVQELRKMVDQFGLDVVQAYMGHVQDNAEESVRRVITRLKDGKAVHAAAGQRRADQVAIRVDAASAQCRGRLHRHQPQQTNNFNAPTAVCMAAVLYVFRTLVDDDIPLNAGCLKPLKVIIPAGSMLNPNPPASVVAGNVETSTCITNALYGALGVMAASQCTMNNFTFGNARYQYYETISAAAAVPAALLTTRGQLAGGFNGTSVVQTHMTNSRLTDPEVLEFRFPVRLESYAIRQGSGGAGRWRGWRRWRAPRALPGADDGQHPVQRPGVSGLWHGRWPERGSPASTAWCGPMARWRLLGPHRQHAEMQAGDVFEIHTPGGGGFGARPARAAGRRDRSLAGRAAGGLPAEHHALQQHKGCAARTSDVAGVDAFFQPSDAPPGPGHDAAHAGGRGRGGDRSDRPGLTTINGVAPDDPFALGSGQKDMKKPARGGFSGRPRADGA
jgi:5-oxoprolinase (ATP-hydrolysing)